MNVGKSIPSRWIQAHAGSGKTYQLVQHIVRLLIEGEPPESILCVTYTNAAAGEMRERLERRLRELWRMDDAALRAILLDMLEREPDDMHLLRARGLMFDLLDSVSGVQFFTLHGFCHYLLGQFPLEAGIPASFTLLDDMGAKALLGDACQSLLDDAIADDALRAAFSCLQGVARDGAVEKLLAEAMKFRRHWLRLFVAYPDTEVLGSYIHRYFDALPDETLIVRRDNHYDDAWRACATAAAQCLAEGSASNKASAKKLFEAIQSAGEQRWQHLLSLFCTKEGEPRSRPYTADYGKRFPAHAEWMHNEQRYVMDIIELIANGEAATLSSSLAVLVRRLLLHYESAKVAQRALDFDDLLFKVQGLLSDDGLRAWVLHKLDHKLKHILLDEAQDTSPQQWEIFNILREELWSSSDGGFRSLLVVGDVKQSIYSFQGAAPKRFMEQQDITEHHFKHIGARFEPMALTQSRRTAPLILRLVDTLLSLPHMQAACVSPRAITQHATVHAGQPSRVTCWPAVKRVSTKSASPFELCDEYVHLDTSKVEWAHMLAATIGAWLENGRILASRGRAVVPSDILILLQTRTIAADIIRALEQRKIPVSGLDRLVLSSHLAVRDHLAFLEWALHPYDDYHLSIALRSPLGGLSEEELYHVAHDRHTSTLWEALCARLPHHPAIALFVEWKGWVISLAANDCLQRMHADGYIRHSYALRFGEEVHEILDALLGEAARFVDNGGSSMRAFVSWLSNDASSLKREQETSAGKVRIMTVHGAKGLESPIVILADGFKRPNLSKDNIVFTDHEDIALPVLRKGEAKHSRHVMKIFDACLAAKYEEYYRLLYVAMTRAEDELYVGGVDTGSKQERPSWYDMMFTALEAMGATIDNEGGLTIVSDAADGFTCRKDKRAYAEKSAYPLPEWCAVPAPAAAPAQRIYSPSGLTQYAPKSSLPTTDLDAAERGVVYHRILQWMEYYAPQNQGELLDWIKQEAKNWPLHKQIKAQEELWQLYNAESLRWMWDAPSHREVNIAGTLRGIRFAGQIDRLVTTPDYRVVIDYKTSANVPDIVDIPEAYLMQMLAYKQLLEADGTSMPVRTALLYTAGPTFYWVDALLANLTLPSLDVA